MEAASTPRRRRRERHQAPGRRPGERAREAPGEALALSPDEAQALFGAPLLPPDSFLVSGNGFLVSPVQTIYAMAASHTHSQLELNFMLEGGVTYRHGGREAELAAGDLTLFWGAIAHQTVKVVPGSRYVCIYLPLEMFLEGKLSERLRAAVLSGGMIVSAHPGQFEPFRLLALVEDARPPVDRRMAELLGAEVLLLLQRLDVLGWRDLLAGQHAAGRSAAGPMPPKVLEMMRFVAEHGHEPIAVADVARAAGLHPNYAMTRFRTALGMTIANYILRHRMMNAQALLVSTRKDLAAIAFEVGFGSVSQFHRAFRTHFACTPAELRRRTSLG